MTEGVRSPRSPGARFDAQDITIAVAVALLAQLGFIAAFSMPSPKLVQADITNDNAQPIAVAITPVLKLGTKNPTAMPSKWQRKAPAPQPKAKAETPLPSTQAQKTAEAIPTTTASAAPPLIDAGKAAPEPLTTAPADAGSVATAASTQGSEQGAENGTETDPLKARAADMYKAQLASWFVSHFNIRGKIPFEKLKTLRAVAQVTVTPERTVGSFSITKPSGDPTFDEEVQATLQKIQSSGAELPAPPPMYPEMLAKSQSFSFQCTVQKQCE